MAGEISLYSLGEGPPLVVLLFSPEAGPLRGPTRWSARRLVRPFSARFTVHVINRPHGMPPTTTMAELAAVYAQGIRKVFAGHPVAVLGISTGGSIALQLAVDHPELVERLVLAGTAHTLGPRGRRAQRAFIDRALAGRRPSPALAELVTDSAVGRRLIAALLALADGRNKDHSDAVAVLHAEDGFDLSDRLPDIGAPTLLIQGGDDIVYPPDLARRTAERIPGARLVVYPGRTHSATFTDRRFARDAMAFLAPVTAT